MGLLAVASAKGSPGVTTASMLIGGLWPRPSLVVECDPAGGDIAARMPSSTGDPLDPQVGLLSLVAAGRRSFYPELVHQHAQQLVGGLDIVAGVANPEQASGLAKWNELAALFAELPGVDVIADLGRVGASTPQNAMLMKAAAVLFLVDTVPSSVVHLRERLRRVHDSMGGALAAPIYVGVVAPPRRPRPIKEIREVLERAGTPIADVFHIAEDHKGAGFFLGQVSGNPSRTTLVRSAHPLVEELARRTAPAFIQVGAQEQAVEPQPDSPGERPADTVSEESR